MPARYGQRKEIVPISFLWTSRISATSGKLAHASTCGAQSHGAMG